ncbi:hypothetical protein [Paraburkholderia elongata]|uniref:Uncharacterized protein n=1 Tax=Paraburkholderia elongata TaxID=2675747 RepID=A0A972P398_9BURK|nr:hypothetical protein [Paraburkholderia elongata]NPT62597.1 hypothetical protein [Paraburkholderia elongata]
MTSVQRIKAFISNFIYEPKKWAMRETYAYKAGALAYQMKDDFNPYREGIESHRIWQKGYDDEHRYQLTLW